MEILLNEFNGILGVPQDDALRKEMDDMQNKNKKVPKKLYFYKITRELLRRIPKYASSVVGLTKTS